MSQDCGQRLGIIVALPDEAKPLLRRRAAVGDLVSLNEGVRVAVCGIGQIAAAHAAQALISSGSTALLSWGTVGGLDPRLAPGGLFAPRTVIDDGDASIDIDTDWHKNLLAKLTGFGMINTGTLLSRSEPLIDANAKQEAFLRTGAVAVDMESLAIAQIAVECRLPFLVLRVVVDAAEDAIPQTVLNAIGEDGRMKFGALGRGLLRDPSDLTGLLRLARNFSKARERLAKVASMVAAEAFLVPRWQQTSE